MLLLRTALLSYVYKKLTLKIVVFQVSASHLLSFASLGVTMMVKLST